MKTKIVLIVLMTITFLSAYAYIHIFSYQDFTDFEIGESITADVIKSNDDGTHGSNDRFGPNNEQTWPDVPGDTNIYFECDNPPLVMEFDGKQVLKLVGEKGTTEIMGLKNVPNVNNKRLKLYYDFYLETNDEDYSFVILSSDKPTVTGRYAIIYEDGTLKGIRRTGRYSTTEDFSIKYDLEDEWARINLEFWYQNELRITVNNYLLHVWEFNKPLHKLPFYYVGNLVDKGETSNLTVYFENFVVAHSK